MWTVYRPMRFSGAGISVRRAVPHGRQVEPDLRFLMRHLVVHG